MPTTLVLGGPRSGKTRHAVSLLRDRDRVTYVATGDRGLLSPTQGGQTPGQQALGAPRTTRLPASWETVRTGELTRTLLSARQPVLIDSLTGWVRSQLDTQGLWDDPVGARETICSLVAELAVAAAAVPFQVVLVGQDLSTAIAPPLGDQPPQLPDHPHHRLLVELNAETNTELSAACRQVHVVIAGRVLDLSNAPLVR